MLDESAIASQDAGLIARIVDGTTGGVPPLDPTSIPGGFSIVDVRHQGSPFLFPIDENGEFGVEDLTPGPVRLIVNVAGFALESRIVELDPGVVRDLGTIALWPSACIAGHVLGSDGNPVTVELWVGRAIDSPRGMEMGLGAASQVSEAIASQGWFGICSLPRDELWIGVRSSPWAVNPIRIAPRDALLEGLQLRAQRGTGVHVRFRDPRPGPIWLCVRESDGRPIWAEPFVASGEGVVSLLPGSYLVSAGQAETRLWSAPMELGDEAVELELPPTGQ